MLDRMNQEIKVGSIIAYGHALGRCAGLRIGKVTKVTEIEQKNEHYEKRKKSIIGINRHTWNTRSK